MNCKYFLNFPVLNSNMVNINRYNPHKQTLFESPIFKSIMRFWDQKVWVSLMVQEINDNTYIHNLFLPLPWKTIIAIYITEISNSSNSLVTSKERSLVGVKLVRKLERKKLNASFSVRRLSFWLEGKILGN